MNYFLDTINRYKVPTEEAALKLREELTNLEVGELISFSYNAKEVKQKGEIVDVFYIVKAKIRFNEDKEPETLVKVEYSL